MCGWVWVLHVRFALTSACVLCPHYTTPRLIVFVPLGHENGVLKVWNVDSGTFTQLE